MASTPARNPGAGSDAAVRRLTATCSAQWSGHREFVHDAAWSPAADLVATGSGDESTRIWNGSTGQLVSVLPDAGPVYRIAWSPDGTHLATTGHAARVTIFEVEASRAVGTFRSQYLLMRGLSWSRDGKRVATATGPDQVVIMSAPGAEPLSFLQYNADDVAFSPVADWLAVAGDSGIFLLDRDFHREQFATANASSIAWAPDGSRLAAMTSSGCYVWSAPEGRLVAAIPEGSGGRPAWSRDGNSLAVPSNTGVLVWDLTIGAAQIVLQDDSEGVYAVAWNAENTHILTGNTDGSVRLWDLTATVGGDSSERADYGRAGGPAVTLFYSYAHEDARLRKELDVRLSLLRREGLIDDWSDRKIEPGGVWASEIAEKLERASIILLLISPDFLASDYCYDVEVRRALSRHDDGAATVIPIILKPVDWKTAPFGSLQALPEDGKPITTWRNRDEAWLNVVAGLREVIDKSRVG